VNEAGLGWAKLLVVDLYCCTVCGLIVNLSVNKEVIHNSSRSKRKCSQTSLS
jgi:hypothetical protein